MNKSFFVCLIAAVFYLPSCRLTQEQTQKGKNETATVSGPYQSFRIDNSSGKKSLSGASSGKAGVSGKITPPAFIFRKIPAGSFTMGSLRKGTIYENEKQVLTEITKPFKITETEVTQKQWFQVMGRNPSHFKRSGDCDNRDKVNEICPDHPVENVSWHEVQAFIKKLNDSMGLKNCNGTPQSGKGCYRLPTEAEWERAARAGTKTAYYFGNDAAELPAHAWYSKNSGEKTRPVKTRKANLWGLHDVYGNVREWVEDGYKKNLPGGKDPLQKEGEDVRILRGGAWYSSERRLRSANRSVRTPDEKCHGIGFRLARTL